ncbi:hypothetical protein C0989_012591 [Termitomyces sp. Mn162]|nr:hypothetical protein C0989_012591 [Termitomyces sp. Mn162]
MVTRHSLHRSINAIRKTGAKIQHFNPPGIPLATPTGNPKPPMATDLCSLQPLHLIFLQDKDFLVPINSWNSTHPAQLNATNLHKALELLNTNPDDFQDTNNVPDPTEDQEALCTNKIWNRPWINIPEET